MATKVITLPTGNPLAAQKKFQEWLDKIDKVLFIVLGDTNIAKNTVEKADVITGGQLNEPRWVIHAPVREDILNMLKTIKDPEEKIINKDWDKVLAFSLSLTDNIRDMIVRDGTEPKRVRIMRAFLEAEVD